MPDALLTYLRSTLPAELADWTTEPLEQLEKGNYERLLRSLDARKLFGLDEDSEIPSVKFETDRKWNDFIFDRLGSLLSDRSKPEKQLQFYLIGYAALLAFVQANVTGPPLKFVPAELLIPNDLSQNNQYYSAVKQRLLADLGVDGIAAYKLTPHVELLCLADAIMTSPAILKNIKAARWAKIRINFLHQRLLSEISSTLQNVIYEDLNLVEEDILQHGREDKSIMIEYLLERSTIHIHHGLDKLARTDLERAKVEHQFEFALTGRLGKRTKFQEKDFSQLVVIAKSKDENKSEDHPDERSENGNLTRTNPEKLDLNDDTLLESISFSKSSVPVDSIGFQEEESLPPALKALDPAEQPRLEPLDSVILLLLASSITNTSPQDGLTREETLPYATRVLDDGSSNWQIYTQALLVRSRIEGYKSRTVERGLLQLQVLVDQVISDTGTAASSSENNPSSSATTFLPKAKESEDAPADQRLRYIFQLATPTRWELEAELASRWVELGGLKSALDIYERLEMWAEAALCWAATEREDKAKKLVRRQLFHSKANVHDLPNSEIDDSETWDGPPRDPPPPDAPRLYCILGDIDQSIEMYETAWEVSNQRYARAQRSLGRHHFSAKDYVRAAEAYSKSLKISQLNQTSWFALGCCLLELAQFEKAAEAFSRCVQLDDSDAEAWSNLAAALLRIDPDTETAVPKPPIWKDDDEEDETPAPVKPADRRQILHQDALKALKRAAGLKHDSYRIWENVLIVASSLNPPEYTSMLAAQKRVMDLRGRTDGEKCIDLDALQKLVAHVISSSDRYDPAQPGLARMVVKFVDDSVVPLITGSAHLWQLVGKLAVWRGQPTRALEAEEKAWRAITSQPGWETQNERLWNEVVEASVRLCDAYESLGDKERTEGLGAGQPVAKDWKFKARSAIRGILGRGKDSWEGTDGWERLQDALKGLRGG